MHTNIDEIIEHMTFLSRHLKSHETKSIVVVLLMELDVPTKYVGFDYLQTTICLYCEDPSGAALEGVYSKVAAQYGNGIYEKQIEQAIRSALKSAWSHRNPKIWEIYFRPDMEKPTNLEFISRIARLVEIWKGCYIEEGSV